MKSSGLSGHVFFHLSRKVSVSSIVWSIARKRKNPAPGRGRASLSSQKEAFSSREAASSPRAPMFRGKPALAEVSGPDSSQWLRSRVGLGDSGTEFAEEDCCLGQRSPG